MQAKIREMKSILENRIEEMTREEKIRGYTK